MTIRDLIEKLGARVLIGEDRLDQPVYSACCSDLMSDVLAYVKTEALLLTGLTNTQVIHTADMMDINCIVFVRGKIPSPELIEYGRKHDMVLLSTPHKMYYASGLLYNAGLGACR